MHQVLLKDHAGPPAPAPISCLCQTLERDRTTLPMRSAECCRHGWFWFDELSDDAIELAALLSKAEAGRQRK